MDLLVEMREYLKTRGTEISVAGLIDYAIDTGASLKYDWRRDEFAEGVKRYVHERKVLGK
jgi:hypothetical protein